MHMIHDLAVTLETMLHREIKKSDLSHVVLDLDNRMYTALQAYGYIPCEAPSFIQNMQQALVDNAQAVVNVKNATNGDTARIPYAINHICSFIDKRLQNDLLLFATDFRYRNILRFNISTSLFGKAQQLFAGPSNNKEIIENTYEKLMEKGFVLTKTKNNWQLADCDTNKRLLKEYMEATFNAKISIFQTKNGTILEFSCYANPSDMKIENLSLRDDDSLQCSATLTEADVVYLKTELHHFKSHITSLHPNNPTQLNNAILLCCETILYVIEDKLGIHGIIWERKESENRPIREKNKEYHKSIQDMDTESFHLLCIKTTETQEDRLSAAWNTLRTTTESISNTLGLFLNNIYITNYYKTVFEFVEDTFFKEKPEALDYFVLDEQDYRERYRIRPTEKNIQIIWDTLKTQYPHITLDKYVVKTINGQSYIRKIIFVTNNPMDLLL